jgi:hypothetical protein
MSSVTAKTWSIWSIAVFGSLAVYAGCRSSNPPAEGPRATEGAASPHTSRSLDPERDACRRRIAAIEHEPALPGAPEFDARRAEILGRARGEALLMTREPEPARDADLAESLLSTRNALSAKPPHERVRGISSRHRHDPGALRALLLREGYVFSADPVEALALVSLLELPELFEEPEIALQRGRVVHRLGRVEGKRPEYRHLDGPSAGQRAELLFGDRVAVSESALGEPLHRDLAGLAARAGFDRARTERITRSAAVMELRFGDVWARALVESEGAALDLACLDAPEPLRRAILAWQEAGAARREALSRLRATVTEQLAEALPFDRPFGEETADRDGQLRPEWRWAYRSGRSYFSFEGDSYPVFDQRGRPHPPQVCLDFVLDSFERASGTWWAPRGEPPGRRAGVLDFDAHGIENRSGVLAFEKFAASKPELFSVERVAPGERIAFRERSRFFGYLSSNADRFRAGDIVAIQGLKNDGKVHQHAILIEENDPISGFPHALADQMRRPRRRTWETIMAEAPLRSLLYRVRPTPALIQALSGGSG